MNARVKIGSRRALVAFHQVLGGKRVLEGAGRAPFEETIAHVCEHAMALSDPPPRLNQFRGSLVLVQEGLSQDPESLELRQWAVFLRQNIEILRHFFDHGYPMRCAINYGEAVEDDPESASGLVLSTFQWAHDQDWSGGILMPRAAELLLDLVGHEDPQGAQGIDHLVSSYPVPFKEGRRELLALNWGLEDDGRIFTPIGPLVHESLMRTFSRHGKILDAGGLRKTENTEAFLWFCRENPSHLWAS